ncbi:hypothetical protein EJ08DRAFT_669591 [Tothia fuscella]|uniref:RGS domain-containing protein n=1 Tax=Tothia fuscella TaxID=1048955 RepID=A0A9P4NW58_9PEZI|nr:hypothetical protein EJ08DRAFT_669591 [Tothia fuscella]
MSTQLGLSPLKPGDSQPRFDAAGIVYITGCSMWTVFIPCGMTFLWHKRHLPFLKIRRLPLTFGATILLHLYWITQEVGYTIAPLEPEVAVFWTMGVVYPIGLGLFFASNAQLLYVAKTQEKYARWDSSSDASIHTAGFYERNQPGNGLQKIWRRFQQLDFTVRTLIVVGVMSFLQILLTVIMFLISRKYHSSWGISGTEVTGTPLERQIKQGQGWEWWPLIAWQFFWYWVVAPITLWRARNIQDTHGWRVQTSVCCIVGKVELWALPMWLIALYVPAMAPCNEYWIPVQWIGISIWFIEAFTVWIPCYQVYRHHSLQRETLDTIALWQNRTRKETDASNLTSHGEQRSTVNTYKSMSSMEAGHEKASSFDLSDTDSMYTMDALEHTLRQNPEPLRQFSALRDFSGENIAFLTGVSEWRAKWPPSRSQTLSFSARADEKLDEEAPLRDLYKRAVYLYANFVSPQYADFPINISSEHLKELDSLFQDAAKTLYGASATPTSLNSVTPFETNFSWPARTSQVQVNQSHNASSPHAAQDPLDGDTGLLDFVNDRVQYWGDIPSNFDRHVFENAEKSIKYLVLTNTWPKFVKEKRVGRKRHERSLESSDSNESKGSSKGYFKVFHTFMSKGNTP